MYKMIMDSFKAYMQLRDLQIKMIITIKLKYMITDNLKVNNMKIIII